MRSASGGRHAPEVRRQQPALERLAGEILHGHEDGAAVTVAVDDPHDVGMRQALQLLRLALQQRQRLAEAARGTVRSFTAT